VANEAGVVCAEEDGEEEGGWSVGECGARDYVVEIREELGGCVAIGVRLRGLCGCDDEGWTVPCFACLNVSLKIFTASQWFLSNK